MPLTSPSLGARAPLLALLAWLGAGCGTSNTLEGSLSEVVKIGFKQVEVTRTDTQIAVSYFTPVGPADQGARDTVFKLTVNLSSVIAGTPADLTPDLDGNPRAQATRAVADDPVHLFAPLLNGSITFDASPDVEKKTSGSFHVFFGDGGDAGKGRTAYGTFSVAAVVSGT